MKLVDRIRSLMGQMRLRPDSSLGTRVANAGMWAFTMRATFRVAQIIKWAILGRLLSPDDFGLMAIATITLGLLEVFSQTGYRQALVQRKDEIADSIDTAWSVDVLRGLAVALVVFLGAPLIANFFNQPEAESIIRVMSLVVVINGFTNMAIVQFDRDLRFDLVFRFEVAQRLTEVVVSIGVALVWPSVWALVIGAIAAAFARVAASFLLVRRRPRFQIIRSQASRLYQYGKWIYAANLLFYATGEIDDILVGRKLGAEALGLYRMSYTISQSVVSELAQTLNQVMFPAMSRIQGEKDKLIAALCTSTHGVGFIAFPLSAVFIVAAVPLVSVLLGDQWLGMTGALQILAVSGSVRLLTSLATIMFQSAGEPHLPTWFAGLKLAVLMAVIFPLIDRYGIEGAAWASLIASSAALVPVLVLVRRYSPNLFGTYLGSIGWPLVNTFVSAAAMFAMKELTIGWGNFAALVAILATGGVVYLVSVTLTSRFLAYRQPRELLDTLRQRSSNPKPDDGAAD
jgi:lipopolysaccharide exporter